MYFHVVNNDSSILSTEIHVTLHQSSKSIVKKLCCDAQSSCDHRNDSGLNYFQNTSMEMRWVIFLQNQTTFVHISKFISQGTNM